MKSIIDGLRYNTETAEMIADTSASCSRSDFSWFEETLYKTKNGNWFLAGTGGPMTKYAVPVDQNMRSGGSAIVPIAAEDARQWLEENGELDALETYFADVIADA